MLLGTEFVILFLVVLVLVLVDRVLTIPCLLMTTDMYCIFSINCSYRNKIATTNFSVVL